MMLEIMVGVGIGLLLLGLRAAVRSVLESASSRGSTGIDLRKHRRMHSDWRVIAALSADAD